MHSFVRENGEDPSRVGRGMSEKLLPLLHLIIQLISWLVHTWSSFWHGSGEILEGTVEAVLGLSATKRGLLALKDRVIPNLEAKVYNYQKPDSSLPGMCIEDTAQLNGYRYPSKTYEKFVLFQRDFKHDDVERVKQLLREPMPTDTKNSRGQTPLWIAAFNRRTDVVKILAREKNINFDSLSASGQSPIFWPSAYGYEDVVDILVSVEAKSYFIDANRRTAVSMARQNGHEKIVRVLLDAQSTQRCESVSVGQTLWWKLLLSAALIFLGFIFGAGMLDKYHQTYTPENSGARFCLFHLG
ncbi:Ankyrin repeat-containing domain protein [Fusarium austroafricanum]|uniref:Ankyrin repeat-containing domain protein n=1 Tax=Fusarium austroafricanum TaxID=2364996 RepID=A0A8H4K4I1_9HYPO|nr:Ankyrin repeat-containing domain protein [Fusarium austroafricanum]